MGELKRSGPTLGNNFFANLVNKIVMESSLERYFDQNIENVSTFLSDNETNYKKDIREQECSDEINGVPVVFVSFLLLETM